MCLKQKARRKKSKNRIVCTRFVCIQLRWIQKFLQQVADRKIAQETFSVEKRSKFAFNFMRYGMADGSKHFPFIGVKISAELRSCCKRVGRHPEFSHKKQ